MSLRSVASPAPDASRTTFPFRRLATGRAAEVRDGLCRRQRELPGTCLSDRAIADVRHAVERYMNERLQGVEAPLVRSWTLAASSTRTIRRVVELFPGGSTSVLPLLDGTVGSAPVQSYLAIDRAFDSALEATRRVVKERPDVAALPLEAEPALSLPIRRSSGTVFALLAGGFARFSPVTAVRTLRALRAAMTVDDVLLLGLDLREPAARVASLTPIVDFLTRWHRHALVVSNREAGTDFAVDDFRFAAFADPDTRRVDEGVVSRTARRVSAPLLEPFLLRRGELVRTSVQYQYERAMLVPMLRGVGLALQGWHVAPDGSHALASILVRFPDDGAP